MGGKIIITQSKKSRVDSCSMPGTISDTIKIIIKFIVKIAENIPVKSSNLFE